MIPFTHLDAIAAPLPIDNVDTDAIIPSRETQSVVRTGYAEKLFANWRYHPGTREIDPDFVLNRPPFDQASVLVTGHNFGCGSSREAAVWALCQFGIRCVIAKSFGTIFRNNCIRNGLLPISLPISDIDHILTQLTSDGTAINLVIDLESCTVKSPDNILYHFSFDPLEREMLLTGADEIDLTLRRRDQIDSFRVLDKIKRPWVYQHARKSVAGRDQSK